MFGKPPAQKPCKGFLHYVKSQLSPIKGAFLPWGSDDGRALPFLVGAISLLLSASRLVVGISGARSLQKLIVQEISFCGEPNHKIYRLSSRRPLLREAHLITANPTGTWTTLTCSTSCPCSFSNPTVYWMPLSTSWEPYKGKELCMFCSLMHFRPLNSPWHRMDTQQVFAVCVCGQISTAMLRGLAFGPRSVGFQLWGLGQVIQSSRAPVFLSLELNGHPVGRVGGSVTWWENLWEPVPWEAGSKCWLLQRQIHLLLYSFVRSVRPQTGGP